MFLVTTSTINSKITLETLNATFIGLVKLKFLSLTEVNYKFHCVNWFLNRQNGDIFSFNKCMSIRLILLPHYGLVQ